MKTYPLRSEENELVGFEIPHNFISSGSIANFIKQVPGCSVTWVRKIFSDSEIHVKFNYGGHEFEVWEPFGDNSRLHIGKGSKIDPNIVERLESKIKTI